jgi:hypothetical protein
MGSRLDTWDIIRHEGTPASATSVPCHVNYMVVFSYPYIRLDDCSTSRHLADTCGTSNRAKNCHINLVLLPHREKRPCQPDAW